MLRAVALLVAVLSVTACGAGAANRPPVTPSAATPSAATQSGVTPSAATPAGEPPATPAVLVPAAQTAVQSPPVPRGEVRNVRITFYAAYDNDPQGSLSIDDPVIHKQAGGTGTFADPLTFASATGPGAYPAGTRIYVPLVQKYFIKEDSCEVSWTAPNGCGSVTHVDLYAGNPSASKAVLKCEEALTPDGDAPIVLDPPATLPYDSTPIWNQADGSCMAPH